MSDSIDSKDFLTLQNLPDDDSILISDITVPNESKYIHVSSKPFLHFTLSTIIKCNPRESTNVRLFRLSF